MRLQRGIQPEIEMGRAGSEAKVQQDAKYQEDSGYSSKICTKRLTISALQRRDCCGLNVGTQVQAATERGHDPGDT